MKIDNVQVYDLNESVVASGLPMQENYDDKEFFNDTFSALLDEKHFSRCRKLANNAPGSGHCNFLSGITVALNVTASQAWWLQMERYHFVQIVSMQSKMHRIQKMIRAGRIPNLEPLLASGASLETLVMNAPMSLELTARISTNYLQLKTIYNQRRNHRLTEWHTFCDWIESLPFALEFICNNKE